MKYLLIVALVLLIGAGIVVGVMNGEDPEVPEGKTEEFIHQWLTNDNGTIATYIQDSGELDEDLVQGRETLAETLGLWMFYALEEDNQALFDEAYDQLNNYFLERDGFVNWKLTENGRSEVFTNALIDDVRIMDALLRASERFGDDQYTETARSISGYLTENNVNNGIYTDFYERADEYASVDITLSYIDIQAMDNMEGQGLLDPGVVEETTDVLSEAPLDNGFYPKSYNVEDNSYSFDDTINIVDQAMTAYHHAQAGNNSEEFLAFIRGEMDNRGLVHGMYDRETRRPTVSYQSPAIYGYLILYTLEAGEEELAQAIYDQMKEFQITDESSQYYGGYSVDDGNTHIFDNLVPLLAEQEIKNSEE